MYHGNWPCATYNLVVMVNGNNNTVCNDARAQTIAVCACGYVALSLWSARAIISHARTLTFAIKIYVVCVHLAFARA